MNILYNTIKFEYIVGLIVIVLILILAIIISICNRMMKIEHDKELKKISDNLKSYVNYKGKDN